MVFEARNFFLEYNNLTYLLNLIWSLPFRSQVNRGSHQTVSPRERIVVGVVAALPCSIILFFLDAHNNLEACLLPLVMLVAICIPYDAMTTITQHE